mgnify:CR=1 FL=1
MQMPLFKKRRTPRVLLSLSVLFALCYSRSGLADDDIYFDPMLLEQGNKEARSVNLAIFRYQNQLPAGKYHLHVWLNGQEKYSKDISFIEISADKTAPVLTKEMLSDLGVEVDHIPALAALDKNEQIMELGNYIPAASVTLNKAQMRLDISIPQASLKKLPHDYIDPRFWDDGLNALFTNYTFSGGTAQGEQTSSQYLNLQNGLNIGPWRLRNYSTWQQEGASSQWDSVYSYLQRDIKALYSQFLVGESYTSSSLFDSVKFQGVQLSSDNNMLPDSLKGFAPTIRGIANSNAEVTVRQNGYVIYQTTVPPGAFEINDLYPTSRSGDLDVVVKEANGQERHFVQPFSSVPIMQRAGQWKYSLTGGKYRSDRPDDATPNFVEGSLLYGLNNQFTLYGGAIGAQNYLAQIFGIGMAAGDWGAVSLDMTEAKSKLQNGDGSTGRSFRFQYSKSFDVTGTALTLAGYRYSTKGFYTFQDTNRNNNDDDDFLQQKRSQIQINISQPVGRWGSFYVNGYQRNFWRSNDIERNLSAGYAVDLEGVSVNVSLNWNQYQGEDDKQVALGISVPLDKWLPHSWATTNYTRDQKGNSRLQTGLSGTALEDQSLNYSVQQNISQTEGRGDRLYDGNIDLGYKTQYANLNLGYYQSQEGHRVSYGASGGIVFHPHGVTLSQSLGDSFALIDANGAKDIHFKNQPGVSTDMFGYAVIPWLSPYQRNEIELDTLSLPNGTDAKNTIETRIPNQGAMVEIHFDARTGHRVLATLKKSNGEVVPFGAMVSSDSDDGVEGIVDEMGVVYLSGVKGAITVEAKWGNLPSQHCTAALTLPKPIPQNSDLLEVNAVCHP